MSNALRNEDAPLIGLNLDDLYRTPVPPPPAVGVGKALAAKVAMSILGSVVVGTVMNLPHLKTFIKWTCHIILMVLGRPDMPESRKLETLVIKARHGLEKQGIVIPAGEPDDEAGNPRQTLRQKLVTKVTAKAGEAVVHKAKEAAEDVKEQVTEKVEEKVTEVKEKVTEIKDTAKAGVKKVVDKLDDVAHRLPDEGGGIKGRMAARFAPPTPPPPQKYGLSPRQKAIKARRLAKFERDGNDVNAAIQATGAQAVANDNAAITARNAEYQRLSRGVR